MAWKFWLCNYFCSQGSYTARLEGDKTFSGVIIISINEMHFRGWLFVEVVETPKKFIKSEDREDRWSSPEQ
jgi:hypothetical protein